METRRTRLRRIEKEAQFRRRLDFSRLLENLSDSQIQEIAIYFRFPGPMPEQLPIGMSKVDDWIVKRSLACGNKKSRRFLASCTN
jgi:hypothetical protein